MPFEKVNGTKYYYEIHGGGDPVVLISGYAVDHTLWLPILESLSSQFQVLVFDNRSCGQTKDDGEKLSLVGAAKDTIDLAKKLGMKKPHIVGQSMGGTIAQTIAQEHPEKICKLVLLVTSERWRKSMLLGLKSLLDAREGLSFDEYFGATVSWVYGEAFLSDPSKVDFLYKLFQEYPHPQSLEDQRRQYELLQEFDGRNFSFSMPTLVINAIEDIISLPMEGEALAKKTGREMVLLPGAHGVIAESSDALIKALVDFFNE